jgi:hypothetical protein
MKDEIQELEKKLAELRAEKTTLVKCNGKPMRIVGRKYIGKTHSRLSKHPGTSKNPIQVLFVEYKDAE